jgi:uncharacterized membrane protein
MSGWRSLAPRQALCPADADPGELLSDDPSPILPAHIEETVQAIARLQAQHESEATVLERAMANLTVAIGQPTALLWLVLAASLWVVGNTLGQRIGWAAPDPPPFSRLQGTISFLALCVTVIILTTQRRSDKLSSHREQLTLELAILGEQKTAKVIELLEEVRRDNPMLRNRQDLQADEMSHPADPEAVLAAIKTLPAGDTSDAAKASSEASGS